MTTPFITIVTGLPRTGTSMMMQMLEARGMEMVTDGKRAADDDNPRGYYELEAATQLRTHKEWLENAQGKAVKVVAQLLNFLPDRWSYRIVFMERDLDEVLASQQKMLERLGRPAAKLAPEQLKKVFTQQLQQVQSKLNAADNIQVLPVSHRQVLEDPQSVVAAVDEFLGGGGHRDAMVAVVDQSLYRNRV